MWHTAQLTFQSIIQAIFGSSSWMDLAMRFVPFVLFFELPVMLIITLGMIKFAIRQPYIQRVPSHFRSVSCIVTCYSEGRDVEQALYSLAHQIYPGRIEIIAVIDGAMKNRETLLAVKACSKSINSMPNRRLIVLPKWQRGGRVSSLNAGLSIATGEIVMAHDGDTSFDNNMVLMATRHFDDPNVAGVAGNLRARNASHTLATRLQALEYMISIGGGKTGLSEFNTVNNISGAFGVFRANILRLVGGWDSGTAEDLDITMRIKQYFGRKKGMRIVFDPYAVGHTDVPENFSGFFRQRLRWDGDLFYLYIRKYQYNIRPALLGWKNFFFTLVGGLFFQLVLPFIIPTYTLYLFLAYDPGIALGVLFFVYLIYVFALAAFFSAYWLLVSERKKEDAFYFLYLPIFPLFAFANRINSAVALLHEIVNHGHLDSAMAPWWVLRKTKF